MLKGTVQPKMLIYIIYLAVPNLYDFTWKSDYNKSILWPQMFNKKSEKHIQISSVYHYWH